MTMRAGRGSYRRALLVAARRSSWRVVEAEPEKPAKEHAPDCPTFGMRGAADCSCGAEKAEC